MNKLLLPDGRFLAWQEEGTGRPLLLLPGWGSSAAIFAELVKELPQQRTLALDLPGYNASSPAATVDLDLLVDDLILCLDALGHERVSLLGWSLGGLLAQRFARRHPQRLERLILIATTPRFVQGPDWPHALPEAAVRALARDCRRGLVSTLAAFRNHSSSGEEHLPLPALPTVELATALGGLKLLRCLDLRPELAMISTPTLVLHGSNDTIIPRAAGASLAAALPAAAFAEINGGGHAPFRSAARQVGTLLRNFLS